MKKRMKTVAAFCAAAILCGAVPYTVGDTALFRSEIIAKAGESDISFDAETGTMTLSGNIVKDDVKTFESLESVLHIVADSGTVFPADCSTMFSYYAKLQTIDLSEADTSGVTSMANMFSHCYDLTSVNLTGKFSTATVTNMSSMFYGCRSITSLDLSSFDTSNVTNMSAMFNAMADLKTLNLSSFNTENVTNMYSMFHNCANLTILDLSSFDTAKVSDMQCMFQSDSDNGTSLSTIIVSDKWSTSGIEGAYGGYMFDGCTALKGGNGTAYDSEHINEEYARIDKEGEPGYFTAKNQTLADGKYKQTAKKDDTYYTRFVFVTPKSEIAGKSKAKFTATHDGTDYTYETNKYYTAMISNSINYTAASADSVLFVVTVSSGSDISADLTCDITFE